MVHIYEFRLEGRQIREIPPAEFAYREPPEGVFYWFDGEGTEGLPPLLEQLGFFPDLLREFHAEDLTPHLEEQESSLTIFSPWIDNLEDPGRPPAVSRGLVFLTRHYFLSVSEGSHPPMDRLRRNFRKEFQHAASAGFLLFLFFDEQMSGWAGRLERLEESAEGIEESVHERASPAVNQEIFRLKKRVLLARKHLAAERDILMRISGKKMAMITEAGRQSLGDLYHHATNLTNSLEMIREILSFTQDSYLSVLSQKMNEVMKVLTLIATIVLPISLVPAIYGMNFRWMPGLESRHGFWLSLGGMGAAGLLLIGYFRRKGWL